MRLIVPMSEFYFFFHNRPKKKEPQNLRDLWISGSYGNLVNNKDVKFYKYFQQKIMKSTLKIAIFLCLIYLTWQSSFLCNVANCQYCSYPNFCGQCQPNNLLTWDNASNSFSCVPLTCAANCQTCYTNGTCQVCISGFFLTNTSTCSQSQSSAANLSINCLWGTSSQNCTLCAYGYSLQAGFCYIIYVSSPMFQNCLVQQAPMICQICQPSYFVGPLGNCILMNQINQMNCNVANCAYCMSGAGNSTCTVCMPGFQLTSQNTCSNTVCNIAGCSACSSSGQCSGCLVGYVLNKQSKTCTLVGYGCSDPFCLICDGPQSCGQCKNGWTIDNYVLSGGVTVKLCHPLACPYNVTNCAKCSYQYTSLFNFQNVLCAQCNTGYSLVNGYCVAQVMTTPFTCSQASVPNCASCSYNNFCASCNAGYVLSPLGICLPTLCNIPNCASCSANYVCQTCNAGYTLSLGFLSYMYQPISSVVTGLLYSQCIPSSISCQIANCAYCTVSGTCAFCASGYDFSTSNICVPACSVTNCLQCFQGSPSYCLTCKPGYALSNNNLTCTPISYSCPGCQNFNTSCFYNWATQKGSCTQCSTGTLLFQGQCFTSSCNIYGCNQCNTWVNPPVCIKCNQGLLNYNGYCQQLNCNNNVPNCILCIQTGPCLGCAQGFLLVNNSGTTSCVAKNSTCQDPNCLQCSSDGLTCNQCAMPYNVTNGVCVCGFQNCLQCSTIGIGCDTCPYPLFASFGSTPGCSPAPSLKHTCDIPNCQLCLTSTQCSICAVGYSLNNSTFQCTYNNCSSLGLSNCALCDSFGYVCHECNAGFMPNNVVQGGQCSPINSGYTCNISGCAICSSSNNSVCANCLPGYFSSGSTQCTPNTCNIQNCFMCLQNNVCSQCVSGFYLTVTNGQQACTATRGNLTNCQGQIANCAVCVINFIFSPDTANKIYCIQCNNGFEFDPTNSVCVPQTNSIPNCKVQANLGYFIPPICLVCTQGFYISSWNTCKQYNPSTNNTNCSVYNCLYCGINSTLCSFCFVPWGISSTGLCQTNVNCSANCQFCTNGSTCLTCNAGFTLNVPNTCVACNVANCQLCQQANICVTCANGFSLTGSNTCLSCNVPGCLNCSSINICSTCANSATGTPQFPSPTGGACFPCNNSLNYLANCLSCTNVNSCGLCQNGYQLFNPVGSPGTCILCNIPNCQSCGLSGSTVVCQTCAVGYSQNGGNCIQCLYPCATCNSNAVPNNCASCQPPLYFSVALPNGTCLANSIPNCVSYNPTNINQCTSCVTFFTLNTISNLCQFNCPGNCLSCSSVTVCTQCVQGYYLPSNGTCTQCQITACLSCSSDGLTCNQCFTGFYSISGECRACPGFCSSCTSNNTCTALTQSTQQVLVTLNQATVLAVCQQNCLSCSNLNPQVCLQCSSGFYLSKGNCFQCSSSCMTCNSTNQNQCLSCYPNNFLISSLCSTCSPNCLTCQNSNQPSVCTSCNSGFYLSNSTCVQGCSLNCFSCTNSTTCTQCLSGYTLFFQNNQTICAPCTTSCRTCAQGQPGACLSCGTGFFLSGTTCIQCASNCNSCTATGCISCISGFFLTSTQSCSPNCMLPCATCSAVTPTKCTSCIAGYTYNDQANSCTPTTSCSGPCQVCPLGYSLSFGNCVQCTASQCQSCNPNSPGQCISCLPGFFLNPSSSSCQACSSSCQTCLTSTGCLTCATGFTTIQNAPLTSTGYQCVACSFPCATCTNTPDYCTSCVAGYQFMGWKCSQSFYFGFQVTLLTNITTFNQNYYNFIIALTNAISAFTPNSITITSISPGSVVVTGGAGPSGASGTKTANQQFSSLDSSLSTNNQIAGMQIGESSVTVVGGSIDYKQVNLALILGICIPVGVLIIAGIILYIYCKKKQSAEIVDQKFKEDGGFNVRESFELSNNYRSDTKRPFEETTAIN